MTVHIKFSENHNTIISPEHFETMILIFADTNLFSACYIFFKQVILFLSSTVTTFLSAFEFLLFVLARCVGLY